MVNEKLETGQILQVKIVLPQVEAMSRKKQTGEKLASEDITVTLISRVVWRTPYNENTYIVGIQFLDLEQEDTKQLKAFLEEYKLQEANIDSDE